MGLDSGSVRRARYGPRVVIPSETSTRKGDRVLTWETLPFYLGGFLGPFGTLVVISIYPELRESFDATSGQVNWSFSGYFIPMAVLLLVSGTIGERLGRRRVIRITFLSYGAASLLCIVAPTLGWFVGALDAAHHYYHDLLDDVRLGFWEGYHEARGG